MKIVQINATCGRGSTGNICLEISRLLSRNNIENYVFYAVGNCDDKLAIRYARNSDIRFAAARSHVVGNYGFNSRYITQKLIKKLDIVKPDIVHLHNVHSHNCHLSLLINYLSENNIKTIWTFHDCWAFTGYCTHFIMTGCDRWRTSCRNCPQYKHFSMFFDCSNALFNKKRELLSRLDLTIVTPSRWLADIVKQSFLRECGVEVIHNGIDLSVFKPSKLNIRKRYGISEEKSMLLGVAYDWGMRKGLDVFCELADRLDTSRYQIVLAGISEEIRNSIPNSIITVSRLSDQTELAQLYSAADIFINPTREDTFPTVNMEAAACGTPVVTSDVGGCPETVGAETGIVVSKGDIEGIIDAIKRINSSDMYSSDACRDYACKHFDKRVAYQSYLSLYNKIIKNG